MIAARTGIVDVKTIVPQNSVILVCICVRTLQKKGETLTANGTKESYSRTTNSHLSKSCSETLRMIGLVSFAVKSQ